MISTGISKNTVKSTHVVEHILLQPRWPAIENHGLCMGNCPAWWPNSATRKFMIQHDALFMSLSSILWLQHFLHSIQLCSWLFDVNRLFLCPT